MTLPSKTRSLDRHVGPLDDGANLDGVADADLIGVLERHVAVEAELVDPAEPHDGLVGLDRFPQALHPVGDIAGERSGDDVLLDGLLGQLQLGLGQLLVVLGLLKGRMGGGDLGLGLIHLLARDVRGVDVGEVPGPSQPRYGHVFLRVGSLDRPERVGRHRRLGFGQPGHLVVEPTDRFPFLDAVVDLGLDLLEDAFPHRGDVRLLDPVNAAGHDQSSGGRPGRRRGLLGRRRRRDRGGQSRRQREALRECVHLKLLWSQQ